MRRVVEIETGDGRNCAAKCSIVVVEAREAVDISAVYYYLGPKASFQGGFTAGRISPISCHNTPLVSDRSLTRGVL